MGKGGMFLGYMKTRVAGKKKAKRHFLTGGRVWLLGTKKERYRQIREKVKEKKFGGVKITTQKNQNVGGGHNNALWLGDNYKAVEKKKVIVVPIGGWKGLWVQQSTFTAKQEKDEKKAKKVELEGEGKVGERRGETHRRGGKQWVLSKVKDREKKRREVGQI